ncbi:MAG: glucose 1-dehydrogenase [Dehalococcoidia bacterium]
MENKVAIVTGGASGLGEATTKLFASEGATVIIADVLEEEGRKIEANIAETGGVALFSKLDVTDERQWQNLVGATVKRFGKLDVLVNNAGISGSDPDLLNTEAWDNLMEINAKGVFLGVKHAIPEMLKVGNGAIVNISSISGVVGQEYVHMGYSASKGAVRLLTKTAAIQYAKKGIRVNSVHPGVMDPMLTSKITGPGEIRDRMVASVPLGREGTRLEIANAVLFLASDEASYITGAELMVDGGFSAV